MTERFNKAYNTLVKAFYNGTLAKGSCAACAVGNLVAEGQKIKIKAFGIDEESDSDGVLYLNSIKMLNWQDNRTPKFIRKDDNSYNCIFEPSEFKNDNLEENLKTLTGYNTKELSLIETAFENNTKLQWWDYRWSKEEVILEDQYKGLCAVVDVLLELDNIKPENHYKQKFREHPKLVEA